MPTAFGRGSCAMCRTSIAAALSLARSCASRALLGRRRARGVRAGWRRHRRRSHPRVRQRDDFEFRRASGLEKTAEASGDAFKIFQLYVRGDADWVDDHVRRAIDNGHDALCFTIDTDSHSRRERDIAKRHQRRRARVSVNEEARIYQARFNWHDIERIKKNFDIPIVLKGIRPARQVVTPHVHSVFPHLNLPRETY